MSVLLELTEEVSPMDKLEELEKRAKKFADRCKINRSKPLSKLGDSQKILFRVWIWDSTFFTLSLLERIFLFLERSIKRKKEY